MATEAQTIANRRNSKKSTGPRSPEGKAVVSKNAVKHGLFASENVIKGEKKEDFDLFRSEMLSKLAPVGPVESMLSERVISLSWRLSRAGRMQNQAIDVMIQRDGPSPLDQQLKASLPKFLQDAFDDPRDSEPELVLGRAAIKDYSNSRVLDRLMMYERRIESSMLKMMNEIRRQQIMRQKPSPSKRDEAATRTAKEDLKKQSQFVPAQIGAKSFAGEDYESRRAGRLEKNKANQPAFRAPAGSALTSGRKSEALNPKSETSRMEYSVKNLSPDIISKIGG